MMLDLFLALSSGKDCLHSTTVSKDYNSVSDSMYFTCKTCRQITKNAGEKL